jgi:hypothetical protein
MLAGRKLTSYVNCDSDAANYPARCSSNEVGSVGRLVRRVIEYEYLSGLVNRPRCWLLGHEGLERRGYIRCDHCGQKVRA